MSRPGQKGLGLGHFDFLSRDTCNRRPEQVRAVPAACLAPYAYNFLRNKKDGAPSDLGPWWSAYAITRETWLDRSPRENPPPTVGDASADVDRRSKSQARHFSPGPSNTSHFSDRRIEFHNDFWPPSFFVNIQNVGKSTRNDSRRVLSRLGPRSCVVGHSGGVTAKFPGIFQTFRGY